MEDPRETVCGRIDDGGGGEEMKQKKNRCRKGAKYMTWSI